MVVEDIDGSIVINCLFFPDFFFLSSMLLNASFAKKNTAKQGK